MGQLALDDWHSRGDGSLQQRKQLLLRLKWYLAQIL